MAKDIVIFDVIGKHCGMHYYDVAFANLLKTESNNVAILSNFEYDSKQAYMPNFFLFGKIHRTILMVWYAFKLFFMVLVNRNTTYIYLWYGEKYDLLFALCSLISKNVWLDVHEVHALKYADNSKTSQFYCKYFKYVVKNVIYHSDRTKNILAPYRIKMLYVPHFKYGFQKKYDETKLSDEVRNCFKSLHRKYLFFGNLTTVKGIDIVEDVFNQFYNEGVDFELVVAGKNVANIDFSTLNSCKGVVIIERHISDDELVYLYSNTDYVLLPYKKSSQSGILAMSAYFKKPMLLSDIPYFKEIMSVYPSFGMVAPLSEYKELVAKSIMGTKEFFAQDDCDKFEMKMDFENFKAEFLKIIVKDIKLK